MADERHDRQSADRHICCLPPTRFTLPRSLRWSRAEVFASTRWRSRIASPRRLLKQMIGNIEAYLACCQLGITMASLGLGWVGEPTVAALLTPVLTELGMSDRRCISPRSWSGSWCSPRCISSIGEQVPKTLAIREPVPVSQWIAYPLYRLVPAASIR